MHSKTYRLLFLLLGHLTLVGCDRSDDQQIDAAVPMAPAPHAPTVSVAQEVASSSDPVTRPDETRETDIREIEWDALIPEGWRPDVLWEQYDADELTDDDPRAQQLLEKLMALWKEAPVVPALEGQRVKLPGFVVPLEMDTKSIDQFLLVPYFGRASTFRHRPPTKPYTW